MFRATNITSGCSGLVFGWLSAAYLDLAALVFFPVVFFLVIGLPQYREAMARRRQRAACGELQQAGDWPRFRDDLRLFYAPTWSRMLTFLVCVIIASLIAVM
jgi:hypothetical protein